MEEKKADAVRSVLCCICITKAVVLHFLFPFFVFVLFQQVKLFNRQYKGVIFHYLWDYLLLSQNSSILFMS